MRPIERTGQFKRDYKRGVKGVHRQTRVVDLLAIVALLADDQPLAEKHRDHPLSGDWQDHRDCHIKLDLVLIYRRLEEDVLQLVRMGSHSELGL